MLRYYILLFAYPFISCTTVENTFQLTLLHNTETRFNTENLIEVKTKLAKISHILKKFRRDAIDLEGPPMLYFYIGDIYNSKFWENLVDKKLVSGYINHLNPDAVVFDYYNQQQDNKSLKEYLFHVRSPVVVTNSRNDPAIRSAIKPSMILNRGGKSVGVLGYVSPKIYAQASNNSLEFLNEILTLNVVVKSLKQRGVHIIIILCCCNYEKAEEIAKLVDGINIIIGEFTNTFDSIYPTVVHSNEGRRVLLVHASDITKHMGRLDVKFDQNNSIVEYQGESIFLNHDIPEDLLMLKLFDVHKRTVRQGPKNSETETTIGKCIVMLDAANVREGESNVANFLTDSMVYFLTEKRREKRSKTKWTDTPIAIIHAGTLTAKSHMTSRRNPNITRAMLTDILNMKELKLVIITLSGDEIVESLEYGARSNGETPKTEFLQFSGMRVLYDFSKRPLSRVVHVKVLTGDYRFPRYNLINKKETYTIVTTTYLTNGGDGHNIFRRGRHPEPDDTELYQVLLTAIQTQGEIRPECDERIQFKSVKAKTPALSTDMDVDANDTLKRIEMYYG